MARTLERVVLLVISFIASVQGMDYGAESNPTGNPIGGGKGYSNIININDADYVVDTKAELLSALNSAVSGDIIFIEGSAEIDLTGESNLSIPEGVTLASDRGRVDGETICRGGLIYSTQRNLGTYPLLQAAGAGVRITGLRLKGPDTETGDYDYANFFTVSLMMSGFIRAFLMQRKFTNFIVTRR